MTLDYARITEYYSRGLLLNELSGNQAAAYRFSKARGGTSGISFGVCQWDLSNNLAAAGILKTCGFSQAEIAILERGKLLQDMSPFNAKLLAAKAIVDKRDTHEIGQTVAWVRDCCQSGDVELADEETFVHLCDYHNQYSLGMHGKCIRYLQTLGCPVTAFHIREFKLDHTKYGETEDGKDDINRRWNNIHGLFNP